MKIKNHVLCMMAIASLLVSCNSHPKFETSVDAVEGNMQKGWIYQIKESVPGRFIFVDEAFREQQKEMKNISCGHLFFLFSYCQADYPAW